VDYPPIQAEVALERALSLQPLGDAEGAARAYRSAIEHAARGGHEEILHTAVIRLMYLLAFVFKRPDEALSLRELNVGLGDRLGDEARAWSVSTMGVVLDAKGEHEAAITEHEVALDLWLATVKPDDDRALMARDQLGHALAGAGKHGEALAMLRESATLRAKKLGDEHPTMATAGVRVGEVLMIAEEYAEAEVAFRGALDLISRVLGPDHTAVGRWRNDLGDALLAQGKLDEAQTEYQRALEAQTKIYGAAHPNVERSREGLSRVHDARGSLEGESAGQGD